MLVTGSKCPAVIREVDASLSVYSLRRHRAGHLPARLVRAREAGEVAGATDLLEQLRALHERALRTLEDAEKQGEVRTVLLAMREARRNLELLARLTGPIDERPIIPLLEHPEWVRFRDALFEALAPHPQVRREVADRLARLDEEP